MKTAFAFKQILWGFVVCVLTPCFAIPNPASLNCVQRNFYELMLFDAGGWSSFCVFPDHSYCEEWQYLRRQCKAGMFYWPEKNIDYKNPGKYCLVVDGKEHVLVMRCKTAQLGKPGFINAAPPIDYAPIRR